MKKILTLLLVLVLCMSVFVACKNNDEPDPTPDPTPEVTYDAQGAADYLEGMYKEEIAGNKAADFTVVPQVKVGTVTYPVTWTVDTDKVTVEVSEDGKTVTVNVPEKSDEDFSYKLTATITAGDGTTASVVFDLNVVKYGVNTHEEYMNAQKDDELTVEGIVVAMNSVKMGNKRNHLFLADASVDGGYYCYNLAVDPAELGIQVGMTVSVTAKMSPYSGMQELNGGTPVIVDKTIKTVEPLDITTQFAAKENLAKYVGLAVTIKGVDIGAQDLAEANSQYLYFYLGDAEGYVRTYVTDFPAGMLVADDKATIDADHAAHFGYKADVTGILVLYGTEHPYLIPMSVTPFTNYEEVTKTPDEKVAAELAGVTLDASLSADKVIDLLLVGQYYNDVTLEWTTTDETGAAVIADGKLTLTVPDEAITVTITVKATCGEVSNTKTLTVKLSKTITALGEASAIGAAKEHNTYTAEKYIVGGIIVEVSADKYGNMTIKDEDGNTLYVYGTYIDGTRYGEFEGDKPVIGDYVVIIGVLGQYNGKAQMKNGDITSFVHAGSIKDAVDAGAAQDHNTYTENKFLVTGVIESIANDKYGNLTIKDAEGNSIYVYGLYNQTGVRYDALTVKPVAGDTITILGVAGKYNDTVQLKNATLVAHTAATTEEPECEHTYENGVCTKCGENDPTYVTPSTGLVVGQGYTISADNANGTLYFDGTITDGRFNGSLDATKAVVVYVEEVDGGYLLYFFEGETKTYVVMADKSAGGSFVTDAATATVFEWNAEKATLAVADDSNNRAFGAGATSTYNNFSAYDITGSYNWGAFTPVEGGETPDPEPECEHNYVDGVCTKCGEADPNYVPPHEHEFVNGECACGEKDPNYVAPEEPKVITIPEALEIAKAQGDTYTTDKYYITGMVTNISNTFYGNFHLVDADGNDLYVYGLKKSDGTGNFSELDPQPAVGDTITIYTVLGCYNGAPQAKDAWLHELVQHTEHIWADATCKVAKTCTICGKTEGEPLEHTYVDGACTGCGKAEPAQGAVITSTEIFAGLTASGSYKTVTTTSGWTATNAAVLTGGTKDSNPVFMFIGSTADTVAIALNGKTTAVGKLTSATLQNGISKLSFNYGNAFSEANGVDVTINILQNGEVVATTRLDNNSVTQKTAYEFVWELDQAVEGEFVIEIVNNSPTNSTSNKDRIAIFNFTWDSAPIAEN